MPYYSKNTGRNAEARHVLKENPTIRKQGKLDNTEKFKTAEGSEQQAKVFTVAAALNLPLENCKK